MKWNHESLMEWESSTGTCPLSPSSQNSPTHLTFPPCCATGLPTAGVWICRLISSRFGMHRRNLFRHRLLWLHRNWWCFQNQSKVLIIIKKVLFVCKETLNLLWTNKLLYTASVSRGYGRNRKQNDTNILLSAECFYQGSITGVQLTSLYQLG